MSKQKGKTGMKNKKIIGILGVAAIAVTALVACGSTKNTSTDKDAETKTVEETENDVEKDTKETEIMLESEYDASTEIPMLVYGPPESFEDTEEE